MSDVASQFNFSWIDDHMCGFAFPRSEQEVAFLAKEGVDVVISLSSDPVNPELAAQHGLKVIHLPVLHFGTPKSGIIDEFFSIIRQARSDSEKVGVHCLFGQGRTGLSSFGF